MLAVCQLGFVVNRGSIGSVYVVDEGRPISGTGSFSGSAREYSSQGKRLRSISSLQRPQSIRVTKSNIYVTDLGAELQIEGLIIGSSFIWSGDARDYGDGYNPFQYADQGDPRFIIIYVKGTNYFEYWVPQDTINWKYCSFHHSVGTNTGPFNMPTWVLYRTGGYIRVGGLYSNAPRVRKYDSKGESMLGFGTAYGGEEGQFKNARGIEVMEDTIYVVDSGNKRVQVFDEYGTYQSSFNTEEDGSPYGIYIDQDNQIIYITDTVKNNCQIYSLGGSLIKSFGDLSSPQGITGADGKIYIAATGSNNIQVFDVDGELVSEFGSGGSGNGEFNSPTDIEVIKNRLFVTDRGNYRIQIFNLDGNYIKKFPLTGLFLRGIAEKRK